MTLHLIMYGSVVWARSTVRCGTFFFIDFLHATSAKIDYGVPPLHGVHLGDIRQTVRLCLQLGVFSTWSFSWSFSHLEFVPIGVSLTWRIVRNFNLL